MKKTLICLALLVSLLASCSKDSANKTITMGTNAAFPPFEFIGGETGEEVVGFDVEIAKEIAKKAGLELKIADMEFDTLLTALNADKVDFVVAGMTINDKRKESVNFSEAYYEATQTVLVKATNNSITSKDDIKDKKVGVQLGTTGNGVAEGFTSNITAFNTSFEAIMELKNGKVDLVIVDEQPAQVFLKKNPDLKMVEVDFDPEFYGIAVKKGNEDILNIINETLKEIKANGKYDELIMEFMK